MCRHRLCRFRLIIGAFKNKSREKSVEIGRIYTLLTKLINDAASTATAFRYSSNAMCSFGV